MGIPGNTSSLYTSGRYQTPTPLVFKNVFEQKSKESGKNKYRLKLKKQLNLTEDLPRRDHIPIRCLWRSTCHRRYSGKGLDPISSVQNSYRK